MERMKAIQKVSLSNPAGSSMPEMSLEELTRIHGGGDVQGETTPATISSMACVGATIRISSQKCAYAGGSLLGGAISYYKC